MVPSAERHRRQRTRLLGRDEVRRRHRGVARLADVLVGEVPRRGDRRDHDPRHGSRIRCRHDDADDGPAAAHAVPEAGFVGVHAARHQAVRGDHSSPQPGDHRPGDRAGRVRLRDRRRSRAPVAGDRGDPRRAAGGPRSAVRLVQQAGRQHRPGIPRVARRGDERLDGDVHLRRRARAGEAHRADRRHRQRDRQRARSKASSCQTSSSTCSSCC